jgi:hypothetical protein
MSEKPTVPYEEIKFTSAELDQSMRKTAVEVDNWPEWKKAASLAFHKKLNHNADFWKDYKHGY